jgi:FkbM family methyltransferase
MILLIGFYEDPNPWRRAELLECLRRNVANACLQQIHVFIEHPREHTQLVSAYPVLAADKVQLIAHGRRVTYRDLFEYANRRLPGRSAIIANADIYFDETLIHLDGVELAGRLLCLSRWDIQPDGSAQLFDRPDSQDAWIFAAPIGNLACDFYLGVPGCDNRLAWEAERAGLVVSNPSRSVMANHLHLSAVRHYGHAQRLSGPTRLVPADFLEAPRAPGAPEVPCATVAFSETMGYTIERLEPGASSHNNSPRPFAWVPEPLRGLPFTQVVAFAVSPVEVTFVTGGKLYVLVGDDWDGARAAATWLSAVGFKEPLPPARTRDGPGFTVWSLVGAAGEHFVIPTQVMLVARDLINSYCARGAPVSEASVKREPIFALTSLPPGRDAVARTRECIRSWQRAGLHVCAFNHPEEVTELVRLYDVEFVAVPETTKADFGKHFVPIHTMLDWAAGRDVPALLINADIELRLSEWELKRARWLSAGGLCYFIRYNDTGTGGPEREPYGIDAFLFHGRDVAGFPRSIMSMGRPFWDYWLPLAFARRQGPSYSVEFPAAFHRTHALGWSLDDWRRCGIDFARCTNEPEVDGSPDSCQALAVRVRQEFERKKRLLTQHPPGIRDWVRRTFGDRAPKTFLELGAHHGTDTEWLAQIPNVTLHAFEPDPRNHPVSRANVTIHRAAVAERDGTGALFLSRHGPNGQEWTHSSSVKQPKNHRRRYNVTFGGSIEVELLTLDTFYQREGLGVIDFIWADIQGAEGEMIRGGQRTLAHTRYLYTEYSDDELYENQVPLHELLRMLPDYRVAELWPDDVLLENRALVR